mmetsp:Transcript_10446/g.33118  ORF Transcript_10446/g.33118 Transcript_10446/m.33118 type:complete len:354 (+) Transcript_10446:554-1615(+)
MRLAHVHLVGASLEGEEGEQPHRPTQQHHHARLSGGHHARHVLADRLGERVDVRGVHQPGELLSRREDGRVREEVHVEALGHHRLFVPAVRLGHGCVQVLVVEARLADLLAQVAHLALVLRLRVLRPLLHLALRRLRLVHPQRVAHPLDVHHHLEQVARLEQPPSRLDVARLHLDHLCEDRRALLVHLALLERTAEAVVPFCEVLLEGDAERGVLQRLGAALEREEGERPISEHLVVVRVGGEDRGVVLDRLLPPLALDGLVAHVAADRRRSLDVLLGHALEGLDDVLVVGVGRLVARVERVREDLCHFSVELWSRGWLAVLDLGRERRRHRRGGRCVCYAGDAFFPLDSTAA